MAHPRPRQQPVRLHQRTWESRVVFPLRCHTSRLPLSGWLTHLETRPPQNPLLRSTRRSQNGSRSLCGPKSISLGRDPTEGWCLRGAAPPPRTQRPSRRINLRRLRNPGGEMTRGSRTMTTGPRVAVLAEARDMSLHHQRGRETGVGTGPRTRGVLPPSANPVGPLAGGRGVEPTRAG